MLTLFGISNCDTVRKARKWLTTHEVEFQFHDFRKQGLERKLVQAWVDDLGWETVVNKRGTTWRQLPADAKEPMDAIRAVELLVEHPTLIKRPVLQGPGVLSIGFSASKYEQLQLQ